MDELREQTIATLKKQVELLNKDGTSITIIETAVRAIEVLTALLVATD